MRSGGGVVAIATFGFELLELMPDGILAVDQQGIIRYANHQAGRLFGQEPATLVSLPVEALIQSTCVKVTSPIAPSTMRSRA